MIGNKLEPFKFWCQKVLPNVYDDSLSYYEYLCKLNEYLNEVIEQINTLTDNMEDYETDLSAQWLDYKTDLTNQWTQTKNYIDNYFNNLNVQTEINNKLDQMASDGSLDALFKRYFDAYTTEVRGIVNQQNSTIATLKARMDTFASLTEGSTTGDAELADIRVGADGFRFETDYSSAGDAVRGQVTILNDDRIENKNDIKNIENAIGGIEHWDLTKYGTLVEFLYVNGNNEVADDAFFTIKNIPVVENLRVWFYSTCMPNDHPLRFLNTYNSNGELINTYSYVDYFDVPTGTAYVTATFYYVTGTFNKPVYYATQNCSDKHFDIKKVGLTNTANVKYENRNLVADLPIIPKLFINGNVTGTGDNFFTIKNVEVEAGGVYYVYTDAHFVRGYDARFITAYNSSNIAIDVQQQVKGYYIAPSTATHIDITFVYKTGVSIDPTSPTRSTGFYYFSQYPYNNNNYITLENSLNIKSLANSEILCDNKRNACINFSFDDNPEDDELIVDLFDTMGVRCGFALITDTIKYSSRMSYYDELAKRGYSILSHNDDNSTTYGDETSYTEEQCRQHFNGSLQALQRNINFNTINGWVTPQSFMKRSYIPYLKDYYNYAFTSYYGTYSGQATPPYDTIETNPCLLKRVSLTSTTLPYLKQAVDLAIANKGFLSFYGHAYEVTQGTLDLDKVKELIIYIKKKMETNTVKLFAPDEASMYYFRKRIWD